MYLSIPVPAFPFRPGCPVVAVTECWNIKFWRLSSWSRALGRIEGGESDFLLVNLFFPVSREIPCSALCKQGLLSIQEGFFSWFFDTSGSGAARRSPTERIRLCPLPYSSKTMSFLTFYANRTGCKETKSEDKKLHFACCWNYTGKFFKEKKS